MSFYWETGSLLVENFIIKKKLLFYHHLCGLHDDTLAKQVLSKQREHSLPGLNKECEELLEDLSIEDDPTYYSKVQWKKLVQEKVHNKNKNDLLAEVKNYKKLHHEEWTKEEYGLKNYLVNMNLRDARTLFSARSEVLPTVQMNFKNKFEYVQNLWKCKCGDLDTQVHLTYCHSYEHLREDLDLEGDESDLVTYYQRVIKERENESL